MLLYICTILGSSCACNYTVSRRLFCEYSPLAEQRIRVKVELFDVIPRAFDEFTTAYDFNDLANFQLGDQSALDKKRIFSVVIRITECNFRYVCTFKFAVLLWWRSELIYFDRKCKMVWDQNINNGQQASYWPDHFYPQFILIFLHQGNE